MHYCSVSYLQIGLSVKQHLGGSALSLLLDERLGHAKRPKGCKSDECRFSAQLIGSAQNELEMCHKNGEQSSQSAKEVALFVESDNVSVLFASVKAARIEVDVCKVLLDRAYVVGTAA